MIKPENFIKIWPTETTMGVTFEQVKTAHTPEEYDDFCQWMNGQTSGRMDNGVSAIFGWDYLRWLRQGKKTQQNKEDWD
jgi:heme/copper-type cytochrome/quinol oxidase subunit 2